MSRSFRFLAFAGLLLTLILAFLAVCPGSVSSAATEAPTSVATSQDTQSVVTPPHPGHWESSDPPVSFDVTTDGNIRNFKMEVPWSPVGGGIGTCTIVISAVIPINADNTFAFTGLTRLPTFKSQLDFNTPTPIATIDGVPMIEQFVVSGEFPPNIAVATGKYKILLCGTTFTSPGVTGTWHAGFAKYLPSATSTKTPTLTRTPTNTRTPSNTPTYRPCPPTKQPSNPPQMSLTPSRTLRSSPTFTATQLPCNTITPTNTRTGTNTPTPSRTPKPSNTPKP